MTDTTPQRIHVLPVGLAIVALACSLVAGCMEAATPSGGLSAQEARQVFVDSGRTPNAPLPWHDGMVLVGVGAIETPTTDVPPGVDAPPYPFTTDSDVGDGRAPEWFLSYADLSNGDAVVVRVGGQDDITFHENHDPDITAAEHPITTWNVDSDKAVDRARGEDAFGAIAGQDGSIVSVILTPYAPDAAVWLVHAEAAAGDLESVLVDATTGRIMQFGDLISAANPRTPQESHFTGSLDSASPQATHEYAQEGQGYDIWANLTYTPSGWPDDAHLDLVLWHDGFDISWETRHHDAGRANYRWLDVGSGPYTISVQPLDAFPDGATVQYTLDVEVVPRP